MKMKSVLGAVLAGALALGSTLAYAQTGPIYLTPKLLYSNQSIKSFDSQVSTENGMPNAGIIGAHYTGGDASDSTFGGGVAIGYDFGAAGYTPVRTELEFLARGGAEATFAAKPSGHYVGGPMSTSHSMTTKVYSVFANAYYDFVNDSALTPYVGGGIGGAYNNITVKNTLSAYGWDYPADGEQSSWNFAWNLGGGLAYQISDTMALDLGYRYSDFGNINASTTGGHYYTDPVTGARTDLYLNSTADLTAHEFILGLRISGY